MIASDSAGSAEAGDHQALIARGGVYAELFALQAAGYEA